ncbi:NAD-P-binding protein [Russula aff. rugulosa BPL654]|nr:NAD-P-binding protein [Russula aff. rugulosa BPL654]
MVDILLIGATGFCGRHAARYILEHPQRSKFTVGLAARSRDKLFSIDLPIDDSVQIFELDILDALAVENAVKQAKVVLNCIGPYWHYGSPVVHACARNGVHYVDITGETPWIFDIIRKFDYLATKTHAIIVPSCGIDSVPADVSVHLASETLGHSPLATSMTSAGLSGGVPGGTIASLISACEDVPFNHLVLSSCDWSLSPVPGARSPDTSLVYRLGPGSRFVGGIGFFNTVNRALVQRTAGLREYAHKEARLCGRGGRGAGAPYGPAFTYTEFTPTGNTVVAFMLSLALGIGFASLTFLAPVRWLVKRLVTQPGSGPADHTLESGGMKYVNVTVSDEPSPRYAKTVIKGRGDPGTLLTAVMVVESALTLLLDELPPLAAAGGVLTPMTALGDSLIHRLRANERIEIETALVDSPDDEISEDKKTR